MDEDAFTWEGSPQPVASPPPQRSLSPRAWVATLTALAAVVAGGVILLGSGGGGASSPVSLAAYTSTQQLGYRFQMTVSASGDGFNFEVSGSGAFNLRPSISGSMSFDVLGHSFEEVVSGSSLYIQTAPSSWYRTTLPASVQNSGVSQNPTAELDYLRAAGTVSDVGQEAVNGVVTTHYHALVDLQRLASLEGDQNSAQDLSAFEQATGSSTLPVDVWIDASHLVRRMSLSVPVKENGVSINASVRIDFLSYGAQPVAAPPPAGVITDTPPASGY